MEQSNYKAIDKNLKEIKKIKEIFIKNLPENATYEDFLNVYNKHITEIYKVKKEEDVKESIKKLMLIFLFLFQKDLSNAYMRYDLKKIEKLLMSGEMRKSINKLVKYTTKGGSKYINNYINTVKMINRFSSRASVIIDTAGVEVCNKVLIDIALDKGLYKYYRFNAVLDNRTTTICRGMSGRRFLLSEATPGYNIPPLHFGCRSFLILEK